MRLLSSSVVLVLASACGEEAGSRDAGPAGSDGAADHDGGADGDSDVDSDSDSDADADPDGGTGGDGGTPVTADDPWAAACPWVVGKIYDRGNDAFFEPSVVIPIDLEMDPADYEWLLANPDLEEYRPAAVTVCGERLEGAGLRFKRSTHWAADLPDGYPKNPMVIHLSEFTPQQKLRGLRHINLEYIDDRYLVAERMNWEAVRSIGVGSRVNHAILTINGGMVGVFTNVERVDRSFAKAHFGDNDGNLYKSAYCGTFEWLGADPAAYLVDPQCYKKETNEEEADYSDLVHFIDVLNNTPAEAIEAELPRVAAMEDMVTLIASLQTLGYGDTPLNGNNFYMYHAADDLFHMTAWDLDGGFFDANAPCEHPADTIGWGLFRTSACYQELPLFRVIRETPAWRDLFLRQVSALVNGAFAPEPYAARVDELHTLLAPALALDPNRRGDDAAWEAGLADLVSTHGQRVDNVRGQLAAEGY